MPAPGVGTRLVEAILARWPGVRLTGPVSEAGAKLYRKFARPFTVDQLYTPAIIDKALRAGMTMADLEGRAAEFNAMHWPGESATEATKPGRRRRKPR